MQISSCIQLKNGKHAWRITDALNVLADYHRNGITILGGDIIGCNLEYLGDNWYFTNNPLYSKVEALEKSYHMSVRYLNDYILFNGDKFYVTIITE